MKKIYICLVSSFVVVSIFALFIIKSAFFNCEDLKGDHIIDTHISIVGDYIFYESKN